jgi:hypothetical protein
MLVDAGTEAPEQDADGVAPVVRQVFGPHQAGDQRTRDFGQQVGLVTTDMPVKRGGIDIEPAGQRANGEAGKALVVDQGDRRLDHTLPGQADGCGAAHITLLRCRLRGHAVFAVW